MNEDTPAYFEIEIVVRGLAVESETPYGLRADRPTLARIEVPVEGARAWSVYRHALDEILAPSAMHTLSDETAERARKLVDRSTIA
jgi:hypothetical protein